MKEIKAKVLMYKGETVAENMLPSGIYSTNLPHLLGPDCTIEVLKRYAELFDMHHKIKVYPESYFANLSKCELVDVTVIIHEKSDGK